MCVLIVVIMLLTFGVVFSVALCVLVNMAFENLIFVFKYMLSVVSPPSSLPSSYSTNLPSSMDPLFLSFFPFSNELTSHGYQLKTAQDTIRLGTNRHLKDE